MVLIDFVPWKNTLQCEHLVCPLRTKYRTKMVPRQSTGFYGPGTVWPTNINFDSKPKVKKNDVTVPDL